MDFSSVLSSYGEVIAEKLSVSAIRVLGAHMRPAADPFSEKIDVSRAMSSLLKSGIVVNRTISPRDLMPKSGWIPYLTGRAGARHPREKEPWWLCISFDVPGGARYLHCTMIPEETLSFPPLLLSTRIMPMNKQIVLAKLSAEEGEEGGGDDEGGEGEEENVILDFTTRMREICGPDGDAFGRKWVDANLVIAEAIDSEPDKERVLHKILKFSITRRRPALQIIMADGSDVQANARSGRFEGL